MKQLDTRTLARHSDSMVPMVVHPGPCDETCQHARRCPKCRRVSFYFARCQYLDCGHRPTKALHRNADIDGMVTPAFDDDRVEAPGVPVRLPDRLIR